MSLVVKVEEFRTVRMTHAAQAFAEMLDAADTPLFTDYQLFLMLRHIYKNPEISAPPRPFRC